MFLRFPDVSRRSVRFDEAFDAALADPELYKSRAAPLFPSAGPSQRISKSLREKKNVINETPYFFRIGGTRTNFSEPTCELSGTIQCRNHVAQHVHLLIDDLEIVQESHTTRAGAATLIVVDEEWHTKPGRKRRADDGGGGNDDDDDDDDDQAPPVRRSRRRVPGGGRQGGRYGVYGAR